MRAILCVALAGAWTAMAAQQPRPEGTSLLGRPLVPPAQAAAQREQLEANRAAAQAAYDKDPSNADAIIWLGRRTAYLGRFRDAIAIFSTGVDAHPRDARMYRHRGHRYITVRELDRAVADLSRAAALVKDRPDEVEPDGQPNARNIPTSTLNTNIYYHLGLAHYLMGQFAPALDAYRECLRRSKNDDMRVATTNWLYLTLLQLGRLEDAAAELRPITADMPIIENASYHRLLLLYKGQPAGAKGETPLEMVTEGYGAATDLLHRRRQSGAAYAAFEKIVDSYPDLWPSFGYIAAEAELARRR
jgi:tetratricopeptide (TPR) repeat protein